MVVTFSARTLLNWKSNCSSHCKAAICILVVEKWEFKENPFPQCKTGPKKSFYRKSVSSASSQLSSEFLFQQLVLLAWLHMTFTLRQPPAERSMQIFLQNSRHSGRHSSNTLSASVKSWEEVNLLHCLSRFFTCKKGILSYLFNYWIYTLFLKEWGWETKTYPNKSEHNRTEVT